MIGGGKVSLLEVKDVKMNYHTIDGTTEAIKNISFKVEKEDFVSIIGPSGCGKSTLLNIISGILIPSSGEVKFSDSSIKNNLDKIFYIDKNGNELKNEESIDSGHSKRFMKKELLKRKRSALKEMAKRDLVKKSRSKSYSLNNNIKNN